MNNKPAQMMSRAMYLAGASSLVLLGSVALSPMITGGEAFAQTAAAPASNPSALPPVVVDSPKPRKPVKPARRTQTSRLVAARRTRSATPTAAQTGQNPAAQAAAAEATNGHVTDYTATNGAIGTKTNAPLISVPQSISVVTRKQMDDQNVQGVPQALRYTPGVVAEQLGISESGLEYLYGRGFMMDAYLDGLRLPSGSTGTTGYNIASVDPYFLQSIQVLHGPASVLYGQASPGGIVDLTSKLPPAQPIHEVFVQTGSYGRIQGGFDLGGPIDPAGQFLYRVTGEGFTTGTQVDHVDNQRVAIAPSFTWRPDTDTSLTVMLNYQNDPKAGYYNFLPAVGTVLPNPGGPMIPRNFDPGDPAFDRHERTQQSIGYKFEHKFDDIFTVRQNFRFMSIDDKFQNIYGFTLTTPTNLERYAFVNNENLNYLTLDNQLQADVSTWMIHHTFLAGLDYTRTTGTESYGSTFFTTPVNVLAPVYGLNIATPAYSGIEHFTQNRMGAYLQDQIKLGGLNILIGGRQDSYNSSDYEQISGATQLQNAHPFTWRAGASYEFSNGVAPYVSYETSFQPNESLAYGGGFLAPTTGRQYEGGIKFQPKGTKSFFTAAVFDLTQQNVATADPDPAHQLIGNFSVSTGEIHSRGVELEAHANIDEHINLIGAYTYDDARVTQSTTTNLGKVPTGVPQNMASLWGTYRFTSGALDGLQFGAGVRYIGETWGDTINSFQVPSYTLVDLGVEYDLAGLSPRLKGYHASVNVTNLLDKYYVASCASLTNCNLGLGRMVLGKLAYRW